MKALTILQPWAEMIARGVKRVENRTWRTKYRGPLAIHAGKSLAWMENEDPATWPGRYGVEMPPADELTFGAIIAIAELVDCVRVEDLPADLRGHLFAAGPWCWVLDGARRIEPVPCKGSQLVWTTRLL
jgi:activating signal cointegrator 1